MGAVANATFSVTGWDQQPITEPGVLPAHARAAVTKTFQGDLEATSTAELLTVQANPADLGAGAGYIASEIITGWLDGREGSFVLQHGGISEVRGAMWTYGNIVPGTGTGSLVGITGTAEIRQEADGVHRITLEYEIPE